MTWIAVASGFWFLLWVWTGDGWLALRLASPLLVVLWALALRRVHDWWLAR